MSTTEFQMSDDRKSVTANARLLAEISAMSDSPNESALIDAALVEYGRHMLRLQAIQSFGTVDFYDDFDIKALRRNRSEKQNAS